MPVVASLTVTVIVVTLNRPDCVRECLSRLEAQTPVPDQIIVVDASADDFTRKVVVDFPNVEYLRNDNGFGRMTASRNIGLLKAKGEIIAFVDDDAYAHPNWLKSLLETYQEHPEAGAIGGRALNNIPGEESVGVDMVGKLTKDGVIMGFFAADTGRVIEVDHIMGCNMSFRREVLAELGGFREDFLGIGGVREDSDMSLRVGRAGHKLLFQPAAVVDHIGAPQAKGKRFDWRYDFDCQRNHVLMLARNFGFGAPIVWRYMLISTKNIGINVAKKLGSASFHLLLWLVSSIIGIKVSWGMTRKFGCDPRRLDEQANRIREHLSGKADKA